MSTSKQKSVANKYQVRQRAKANEERSFFILLHRLSCRGTPKCRAYSFTSAHLSPPRASGEAMGVNIWILLPTLLLQPKEFTLASYIFAIIITVPLKRSVTEFTEYTELPHIKRVQLLLRNYNLEYSSSFKHQFSPELCF